MGKRIHKSKIQQSNSKHLTRPHKEKTRFNNMNGKIDKIGKMVKQKFKELIKTNHSIKWRGEKMTLQNCPSILKLLIHRSSIYRSYGNLDMFVKLGYQRTPQCLPQKKRKDRWCQLIFRDYRKKLLRITGNYRQVNQIIDKQKRKVAQLFSLLTKTKVFKYPFKAWNERKDKKHYHATMDHLKQVWSIVFGIQKHNKEILKKKINYAEKENVFPWMQRQSEQKMERKISQKDLKKIQSMMKCYQELIKQELRQIRCHQQNGRNMGEAHCMSSMEEYQQESQIGCSTQSLFLESSCNSQPKPKQKAECSVSVKDSLSKKSYLINQKQLRQINNFKMKQNYSQLQFKEYDSQYGKYHIQNDWVEEFLNSFKEL